MKMKTERKDKVVIEYSDGYELIGESSHVKSAGWSVVYRGGGQHRTDRVGSRQECEEWLQDRGHAVRDSR